MNSRDDEKVGAGSPGEPTPPETPVEKAIEDLRYAARIVISQVRLRERMEEIADELAASRSSVTAPAAPRLPVLEWEGPDEEGDYIVTVKGLPPHIHFCAHGKTPEIAMHFLGDVLLNAFADDCVNCQNSKLAAAPVTEGAHQRPRDLEVLAADMHKWAAEIKRVGFGPTLTLADEMSLLANAIWPAARPSGTEGAPE